MPGLMTDIARQQPPVPHSRIRRGSIRSAVGPQVFLDRGNHGVAPPKSSSTATGMDISTYMDVTVQGLCFALDPDPVRLCRSRKIIVSIPFRPTLHLAACHELGLVHALETPRPRSREFGLRPTRLTDFMGTALH